MVLMRILKGLTKFYIKLMKNFIGSNHVCVERGREASATLPKHVADSYK